MVGPARGPNEDATDGRRYDPRRKGAAALADRFDSEPALDPGTVSDGRYVVEAWLGRGATGSVFRVRHRETGRTLALKLLREPWEGAERCRREERALGTLAHPNIVSVTDYGVASELGGRPYLVTEYLEGPTLRQRLADSLDRGLALTWLEAIAEAVDHAHARGVKVPGMEVRPVDVLQDLPVGRREHAARRRAN